MWYLQYYGPHRPCSREVTELRTAYPHHGNLTPPRISPSRFREYHYHPGCHRLHRELPYGLWRDSRSASPISRGSPRTSQVAITRTDVSVLAYSVFNVQQRFPKRSLYLYMEFRRPFCPPPWKENFLLSLNSDNKAIFYGGIGNHRKMIPLLYMKWERPFLNGFAAPDWKVGLIVALCRQKMHKRHHLLNKWCSFANNTA